MEKFLLTLILTYLLTSCYYLANLLKFKQQKQVSSIEDGFLFFVLQFLTTIFWFVVFPFSLWDSCKKGQFEFNTVAPIFFAILSWTLLSFVKDMSL
jgi:hypothetical protein